MSLKDSKDSIEQLYGNIILEHFPNYEKFWVKFIGNPRAVQVEPYKYQFPDNMASQERDKINRGYEKIQITHYTLFCHLAGAHFHKKELENAGSIKDPNEKYFRYCEHFEVAYMHLGSAFYVLEALWNTVLKLAGYHRGEERFGKLKSYLNQKGKSELVARLEEIDKTIMVRRHLPVHYARAFAKWYKDELYVPLLVKEDMMWSQAVKIKEWRKSDKQLHSDIVKTEKLINDLHEVLISEYGNLIASKNIKIDYGG